MKNILEMTKNDLLSLDVKDIDYRLTAAEILHMAKTLGAFWTYDYEAAKQGKVGMHALLKSGLHSDGFFVSKIFLESKSVLNIVAHQMSLKLSEIFRQVGTPDYIVGVPDGATKLGERLAEIFKVRLARMEKIDGSMIFKTEINRLESVLIVEDVCTRGTGFSEAVKIVQTNCPQVYFICYDPVILNRGGLKKIVVERSAFEILSLAEVKLNDWTAEECPLCKVGSTVIKPKATDENWEKITTSQL